MSSYSLFLITASAFSMSWNVFLGMSLAVFIYYGLFHFHHRKCSPELTCGSMVLSSVLYCGNRVVTTLSLYIWSNVKMYVGGFWLCCSDWPPVSLGVLTNGRDSQKQTVMSLTNAQSQALLQQVTHTLPRITHLLLFPSFWQKPEMLICILLVSNTLQANSQLAP